LNRGPFALEGGRGSIVQTLIFRLAGQDLAIAPSYRYACDLGEASAETSLTGRPSGSPLSRYYACDLQHGHRYEYKQLDGSDASDRSP